MRHILAVIFGRTWPEASHESDWPTNVLFALPSFMSGYSRPLDLFGVFDTYNQCRTPMQADSIALYSDWRVVGQDLRDSIKEVDHSLEREELFA